MKQTTTKQEITEQLERIKNLFDIYDMEISVTEKEREDKRPSGDFTLRIKNKTFVTGEVLWRFLKIGRFNDRHIVAVGVRDGDFILSGFWLE